MNARPLASVFSNRMIRAPKFLGPIILALLFTQHSRALAQTTTVFDVLAATQTLTVVGSTTFMGGGFSVGGSTLVVGDGMVGIGLVTMSPATTLDVNGSAQFGSGATKSTFTASGQLQMAPEGILWPDGTTTQSGGGVGALIAEANIDDAGISSWTISGLNGNAYNNIRIVVDGKATGSSNFLSIQPNGDATSGDYNGQLCFGYPGLAWQCDTWSGGMVVARMLANSTTDTWHTESTFHAASGTVRVLEMHGGSYESTSIAGPENSGGAWNNTTSNITSLTFVFGGTSFIGTVTIYQD